MDSHMRNDSWERLTRARAAADDAAANNNSNDIGEHALSQNEILSNAITTVADVVDTSNDIAIFPDYVNQHIDNAAHWTYESSNANVTFDNNFTIANTQYFDEVLSGGELQASYISPSQPIITCEPWNDIPSGTLMQLGTNCLNPINQKPCNNNPLPQFDNISIYDQSYIDYPQFAGPNGYYSPPLPNNSQLPYQEYSSFNPSSDSMTSFESQQPSIASPQYLYSPQTAELSHISISPSIPSDDNSDDEDDDEFNHDNPFVPSTSRGRGRPKVYKTDAEKRAARADSQKRYEEKRKAEQRKLEIQIKKVRKLNQALRRQFKSMDYECREFFRNNQMFDSDRNYIRKTFISSNLHL